jgi:Na+-transporting NADH:ubiquinone oxidoreductase subunit C
MFLITLCFTSMVSAVKHFNEDRIRTNEKVKFQRIVLEVLGFELKPGAAREEIVRLFDAQVRPFQMDGRTLYRGYEADGQTIRGYAFPVSGPGFWGPIYGMAGVDAAAGSILGIAFYRHSETPGLGGRITETWFQEQFADLSLEQGASRGKLFTLGAPGPDKSPHELDAITGATETSRAVEAFLNRELARSLEALKTVMEKG